MFWLIPHALIVICVLLLICIGAAAVYIYKIRSKYRHIPGPEIDSFWFGNKNLLASEFKTGKFFEQIMYDLALKYGNTFKIFILHVPIVFTADPDSVKDLLVTGGHPKSPRIYKRARSIFGARFLGNGLVTVTDQELSLKLRSKMNPAFNRSFLAGLMTEFNEMADKLVDKLSEYADGKTKVELVPIIRRSTIDIIAKLGFGRDLNTLEDDNDPFLQAFNMILDGFNIQAYDPFSKISPWKKEYRKRVRESISLIRETGKKWILERLKAYENNKEVKEDLLTHVLHLCENEDDFENVLDHFDTFFMAGQDTTGNAIGSALMAIGRHPDVKDKLLQELDDVIGNRGFIDYGDIQKLVYLDMIFKETLRLYPPAGMTIRQTENHHKIGGYMVPANTDIYISTYVSSRLPQFHENSLDFCPERFSSHSKRPDIYTYFPFTLGPRMCIGQDFAKIEVKLVIAKILQKLCYKLDPNQSFEISGMSTLRPKDGVICTLAPRF